MSLHVTFQPRMQVNNVRMLMSEVYSIFCAAASPAMRGSTPLDVAASSVMDNNGLALALEEPDLDKVELFGNCKDFDAHYDHTRATSWNLVTIIG